MSAAALRLGTRGSRLALWQAHSVASRLQAGGASVEIIVIRTAGDHLQTRPLSETGTKRLFVKEIEDAMLHGDVDLAVHSAKDMPALLPEGLAIAAALPREDPRDALALPAGSGTIGLAAVLARLGNGASIGTSSVRRRAQLIPILPGATFAPIRGNVDTRLKKLDDGEYGALVLAAAGMRRLGVDDRISAALPFDICVPAPGQGIIATAPARRCAGCTITRPAPRWRPSGRWWRRSAAAASCRSAASPSATAASSTCRRWCCRSTASA
jgi:hydroxymethylbilane synthase